MKFIGTKLNGSKRLKCTAPLDVRFISEIERDNDGGIFFCYDLRDFQAGFPVSVLTAYISVIPASDNLIVITDVSIDHNSASNEKFEQNWCSDCGFLEFEVELSTSEEKRIMLFLLNSLLEE